MSVVFLSPLFIFELIQQAALVNFMLYINVFKILKLPFSTFWGFHISFRASFYNSTVQTATISKAMIKFWSKFHIQILSYSFSRHNRFLIIHSQFSRKSTVFRNNYPQYAKLKSLSLHFFLFQKVSSLSLCEQINFCGTNYDV